MMSENVLHHYELVMPVMVIGFSTPPWVKKGVPFVPLIAYVVSKTTPYVAAA